MQKLKYMDPDTQPICPWCGEHMEDFTNISTTEAYYICGNCGARSPAAKTSDEASILARSKTAMLFKEPENSRLFDVYDVRIVVENKKYQVYSGYERGERGETFASQLLELSKNSEHGAFEEVTFRRMRQFTRATLSWIKDVIKEQTQTEN